MIVRAGLKYIRKFNSMSNVVNYVGYDTEILDVEMETSPTIVLPNTVPNVIGKTLPTDTRFTF